MRPHAPPPVVNAVRLMVLRAGIGLISVVVLLLTRHDFRKRILERTPTASDATIDTALWVGVVVGVLILVCYLFLARLVRQGVNWARIVTWAIAGLGILGAVAGFSQPAPPVSRILGVAVGIIDVVILVLLVQPHSHAYFRDRAAG